MDLTKAELRVLLRLTTPAKIQDYLQRLEIHFEDVYWSPRRVMQEGKAQCLEGAVLAALALLLQGEKPLLMDLKSSEMDDEDHIVALFRKNGLWGAISKTNHAVLRYREPIFRDLHALAASYFHEYFLPDGTKTLVSYSTPLNLNQFNSRNWATADNLVYVARALDRQRHIPIAPKSALRSLRRADSIEIKSGNLLEWKKT